MTFTLSYWLKSSFDGLSLMILYLWVCINPPPFEAKFSLSSIMLNVKSICYKATLNPILDTAYSDYCQTFGFMSNEKGSFGVERKFWILED